MYKVDTINLIYTASQCMLSLYWTEWPSLLSI